MRQRVIVLAAVLVLVLGGGTTLAQKPTLEIWGRASFAPAHDLLLKMKDILGEENAPSPKSDTKVLIALFEKALPNYDRDKFYVSHMKKVVQWYNMLKEFASLEFVEPEENTQESQEDAPKE